MTLHEAILIVLRNEGRPMTTREIADVVNRQKLYERGDKEDVPASQISARVNHYLNIFQKVDGKIGLL